MNAIRKRIPPMTAEVFLAWEPNDGRLWQLVDGQPQAMAPASVTHGIMQAELARLIGNHLVDRRMPCHVLVNPDTRPKVNADQNVRIPDLAVTCDKLPPGAKLVTDPRLIIEILSASNRAETWSSVWTYTSQPSVREIVVISSLSVEAHVLRRGDDAVWPESPTKLTAGDIAFDSIAMRVPLTALYRGTWLDPAA